MNGYHWAMSIKYQNGRYEIWETFPDQVSILRDACSTLSGALAMLDAKSATQ